MLTYQNGVRYTEDSSFDAASAFQLRSELEEASIVSDNASLDEQELIKAAQAELRKAGRSNDRALDKRKKTQLAAEILQDGGDYAAFVQRLAGVLKKKSGGLPTVTLEYRNVCVETDALVGDGGNPTVWNSFKSLGSKLLCAGGLATKPMSLLKDVSGVIKPGRLTLVIGPPGSGKSVFLQLLSGRLREHKGLRRSGSIKYNGVEMEDFVVQRTAGLVEQFDYHIPNLTVIETVKFAASCQTAPRQRAEMLAAVDKAKRVHLRQQEDNDDSQVTALEEGRTETGEFFSNMLKNAAQEGGDPSKNKDAELEFLELMQDVVVHRIRPYMTLHLLGLSHVADTFVGNETLRGVSGGERKRVTTAEVLVGPQWALFMDEISTGLDSATTYSVVKSLRNSCHALSRTIIISLLQPAPEVMQLFDDLLLLTDGQVIYHGPVDGALPFFSTLGFDCPARKDPASFLLEVTTPVGQVMYASPETLDSFKVPSHYRSPARLLVRPPKRLLVPVSKISASFWETEYGKDMKQQLEEAPFDPKDANPSALARSHYARSGLLLALLALRRQMILIRRDRSYYIARVVQAIIMALIISSLFATVAPGSLTDESAVFSQGRKAIAVLVISVIYLSFSSMPSLGFVFATKRVFYKHRDNHFFPPWSYVIALLLSQMPSSTLESILYSVILYFISGLTRTASNFFIFLLVTWSSSNCLAGQFRLIAYLTPNMTVANAGGSIWLLLLTITNGFSIIRTSIPPYLIWIYWGINPLAYAIRSLAVNELTSPPWGAAGPLILESFGIFTGNEWIWIGVGYLWGWLLVLTFAGAIALKLTNPPGPRPTLLDEQVKVEQNKRLFSYIRRRLNKGRYGKHSNKEPSQVEVREDSTVTGRIFSATSSVAPEIETSEPSESGSVRSTAEARNTHDQKAVLETVGEEEEEEAPEKDVAVPFIPITLVCRNICYYVNDPSGGSAPGVVRDSHDKEIAGKLQLLHNIDFYVQPGCLTALMGGSGAGKLCASP